MSMDAVTEVLLDRSHQADRLTQMVVVSLVAHAVLLSAVTLSGRLWPKTVDVDPAHMMTISLAGGSDVIQGRNPISNKQIQQAVPDTVKPKNDAPPALAKPEMVEPTPTKRPEPKPIAKPEPEPPKTQPQLHGRTPTEGTEVRKGTARVETGQTAAIPFGGLATGGGPVGGARTDFADFCCPEYLQTMQRLVVANWQQHQGQVGLSRMKFTIQRDGTITDISVEQSAGPFLDLVSQRALEQTRRLPPLPAAFTNPRLTVHLEFQYK
jgi:outer membrane biosynthesis protein TonB